MVPSNSRVVDHGDGAEGGAMRLPEFTPSDKMHARWVRAVFR